MFRNYVSYLDIGACYIKGDGTGGIEENLGVAANREECVEMVKTNEPTANGATFPNSDDPGNCFAEFGMTSVSSTEEYQTCFLIGIAPCCYMVILNHLKYTFKWRNNNKRC